MNGPEFDKGNRMTLEDYYVYCQNNNNDRVRYDKTEEILQRQQSQSSFLSRQSEERDIVLIPQKKSQSRFGKRRPMTGVKDKSRIIGDFEKAKMLQNTIIDKKVDFRPSRTGSSSRTILMKNASNKDLSRINPKNPALKAITRKRGVRPQTAKNFYTQRIQKMKEAIETHRVNPESSKGSKVREAVIQYNTIGKSESLENSNFLSASRNPGMRPLTAFKKGPAVPLQAISAFDQFNRDIIDHKVINESVKRLKPKNALQNHPKRVQSARRKLGSSQFKNISSASKSVRR